MDIDIGDFGMGMWMAGHRPTPLPNVGGGGATVDHGGRIKNLEHQVQRILLLNQALWELVRGRLNLTDADLEALVKEVDLRDGVEDGKMTTRPLTCPQCGRVSSSKHWKCLYCGLEFEKPIMG